MHTVMTSQYITITIIDSGVTSHYVIDRSMISISDMKKICMR
jgi:hypothetical protein